MLVSHSCRFILFRDPLGACPWITEALEPWGDQPTAPDRSHSRATTLFDGMSPMEAELAFDMMGMPFRSYTRIAIIQNPFARMSKLYDRIAETDPVWQTRARLKMGLPDYVRWLRSTRPYGHGAGTRIAPRWRRFGAWSAKQWCADRVTHVVRAEKALEDLAPIFHRIGISPDFSGCAAEDTSPPPLIRRPDIRTSELIYERYAWDMALYNETGLNLRRAA